MHGGGLAGAEFVHLGELGGRGGEADFESFGFTGPAVLLGLGDAVAQVVADAGEAGPLGWVGPQKGAADVPLTELTESLSVLGLRSTDSDSAAGSDPIRPCSSLRVLVWTWCHHVSPKYGGSRRYGCQSTARQSGTSRRWR